MLQRGFRAGVLVLAHHHRLALALGDGDGNDLTVKKACVLRGLAALLRAQCHGVLVSARDIEVLRHVLSGFGHGVDAVLRLHQRVDEAPANGGVFHACCAREGAVGLAHDEGRARHAFHATGNHQFSFTRANGAPGHANGVQAGAAQAVHSATGYVHGQTSEQRHHACDVAVVFTGLVGAAIQHVINGGPVHTRVALYQGAQRNGTQIIGTYTGQRTAVAAKRRAYAIHNPCIHLRHVLAFVEAEESAERDDGVRSAGQCTAGTPPKNRSATIGAMSS